MKRILILSVLLALVLTGCIKGGNKEVTITLEEAIERSVAFINENLMQPGTTVVANVASSTEEYGLYKISITLPDGQEVDSYMTLDGEKFFPQVIDMKEINESPGSSEEVSDQGGQDITPATSKSDKPKVELFVMSHCPYGTQMEKGILPVVEALGDKIDFELKFCDYAMHGEIELKEQLQQYCIQKEAPGKLISYLKCFLESGDTSDACFAKTGINKSTIDSCVAAADKQFSVMENFKNQSTYKGRYPTFNVYKADNTKYGVSGSPTLIINGAKTSASRDSASLLKIICSSFVEAPEECSRQLSSASPSPGFGFGTTGSNTDASCN